MVTPIFRQGAPAGFAGTAAHVPDIGGTPSMGVTDLMAEGLLIPPLQLYREGTRNEEAVALLRGNVRLSAQVWGDPEAQLAAQQICHRRVAEFLDDTGEDSLTVLAATLSCCRIDDEGSTAGASTRLCRSDSLGIDLVVHTAVEVSIREEVIGSDPPPAGSSRRSDSSCPAATRYRAAASSGLWLPARAGRPGWPAGRSHIRVALSAFADSDDCLAGHPAVGRER